MNTLTKGLIMTFVTLLANVIMAQGMPATAIAWELFGITAVSTELIYLGKNYMFPSTSINGQFNTRDILSGLFVAVGSGLSSYGATLALNQPVKWTLIISYVVTMTVGYLAKTFASSSETK